MTRLNEEERKSLQMAEAKGEYAAVGQKPSWIVQPSVPNLKRYLRALSQFASLNNNRKPVQFGGSHWKL